MHIIDGFFLLSGGKPHMTLKSNHVCFYQIVAIDSRHKNRLMLYPILSVRHRVLFCSMIGCLISIVLYKFLGATRSIDAPSSTREAVYRIMYDLSALFSVATHVISRLYPTP